MSDNDINDESEQENRKLDNLVFEVKLRREAINRTNAKQREAIELMNKEDATVMPRKNYWMEVTRIYDYLRNGENDVMREHSIMRDNDITSNNK